MNFDQIVPRVFVGSCPANPADVQALKSNLGVTAVLNLQTDGDMAWWGIDSAELEAVYRAAGIELRRMPVEDFNPEELRRRLPACVEALDELLQADHTVYVHCSAGINRSPSTVVAYLHWIRGMSFDEAVRCVVGRRSCDPYAEAIRLATEDRAKRPH
jgi:protein-tyrosine phosphatase